MKTIIHAISASFAMLITMLFFISTLVSEISGQLDWIKFVKQAIVYGLFVLIPAMMIAGISGSLISRNKKAKLICTKMSRMKIIAVNGILILIPSAILLNQFAISEQFAATFISIQIVELLAGAVNISLLAFNMRDGLKLTGRVKVGGKQIRKFDYYL